MFDLNIQRRNLRQNSQNKNGKNENIMKIQNDIFKIQKQTNGLLIKDDLFYRSVSPQNRFDFGSSLDFQLSKYDTKKPNTNRSNSNQIKRNFLKDFDNQPLQISDLNDNFQSKLKNVQQNVDNTNNLINSNRKILSSSFDTNQVLQKSNRFLDRDNQFKNSDRNFNNMNLLQSFKTQIEYKKLKERYNYPDSNNFNQTFKNDIQSFQQQIHTNRDSIKNQDDLYYQQQTDIKQNRPNSARQNEIKHQNKISKLNDLQQKVENIIEHKNSQLEQYKQSFRDMFQKEVQQNNLINDIDQDYHSQQQFYQEDNQENQQQSLQDYYSEIDDDQMNRNQIYKMNVIQEKICHNMKKKYFNKMQIILENNQKNRNRFKIFARFLFNKLNIFVKRNINLIFKKMKFTRHNLKFDFSQNHQDYQISETGENFIRQLNQKKQQIPQQRIQFQSQDRIQDLTVEDYQKTLPFADKKQKNNTVELNNFYKTLSHNLYPIRKKSPIKKKSPSKQKTKQEPAKSCLKKKPPVYTQQTKKTKPSLRKKV